MIKPAVSLCIEEGLDGQYIGYGQSDQCLYCSHPK